MDSYVAEIPEDVGTIELDTFTVIVFVLAPITVEPFKVSSLHVRVPDTPLESQVCGTLYCLYV